MGAVRNQPGPEREISEGFSQLLGSVCRFLIWAGILAMLVGLGFLIYHVVMFGGAPTAEQTAAATGNIELFRKVLVGGLVAFIVGSTALWWGEEWLAVMHIVISGLLYCAPLYVPLMLASGPLNKIVQASLSEIQQAGTAGGVLAIGVLVVDVVTRVQARMRQGVKADQLKYGKGIKEEVDRHNVFMGKCWQLPYCRKFVRERCPIYHARRCCWREKVGCMCEEEVIKGAMENRAIPKDAVAAGKFIPRNNKLTEGQKRERCRQCVIYNEHQKHKYRLMMPVIMLSFIAIYAIGRTVFLEGTRGLVERINSVLGTFTYGQAGHVKAPVEFQELLLVCIFVILFAYALKLLEYLVFKVKV